MDKPLVFLDIGGNQFGAQSEPCCDGLDSNLFLARILTEFKIFLKDRITIEELISRISNRLYTAGWFIPIKYKLIFPDSDQEILIGTYKARYEQANKLNARFGIQIRTSFEDTDTITVYYNNSVVEKELVKHLSVKLAEILNSLFDPRDNCENIDEINIAEYSIHDNDIEVRDLSHGIDHAEFPMLGLCLHVDTNGKLYRFLQSTDGMDKLIQAFSLYFDVIVEDLG